MSNVRDLMPMIYKKKRLVRSGLLRGGGVGLTVEARAEGEVAVPKSSVPFCLSASLTF